MGIWLAIEGQWRTSQNVGDGILRRSKRMVITIWLIVACLVRSIPAVSIESLGEKIRWRGKDYFVTNWAGGQLITISGHGEYHEYVDRSELMTINTLSNRWHRYKMRVRWFCTSWLSIGVDKRLGYLMPGEMK